VDNNLVAETEDSVVVAGTRIRNSGLGPDRRVRDVRRLRLRRDLPV
jgi:hypothetical protein